MSKTIINRIVKTAIILFFLNLSLDFVSCNKDSSGNVNLNKLEERTWVVDRTAYLLNGKETGTVPYYSGLQSLKSVVFQNGNATLITDDGTLVYPYSILDGRVNIATFWGSAIVFNPIQITNNALVAESGEREVWVGNILETTGEEITEIVVEPEEIVKVGDISIYHCVYRYKDKRDSTGLRYMLYYLDKNSNRVLCRLYYPEGESSYFYTEEGIYYGSSFGYYLHSLNLESLSRSDLLLFCRGLIRTYSYRDRFNYWDFDYYLSQVKELGFTEEESIYLLLKYCEKDNPYTSVKNNWRNQTVPTLTNEDYISALPVSWKSSLPFEMSWELQKMYASYIEKNGGAVWIDGITRHYFHAE